MLLLDTGCGTSWRCSLSMSYSYYVAGSSTEKKIGKQKRKLRKRSFSHALVWQSLSHSGFKAPRSDEKMALNFETFTAHRMFFKNISDMLTSNNSHTWISSLENKLVILCLLICSKETVNRKLNHDLYRSGLEKKRESQILQLGRCPTSLL